MMAGREMWPRSRARAQSSPSTGGKKKEEEMGDTSVRSSPNTPFFLYFLFEEGGETGSGFIVQVGLKLSSLAYTS